MAQIAVSLLALAVLFCVDILLGAPGWFNEPRHFLGGVLAAVLAGAVASKFIPKAFYLNDYYPLLPFYVMVVSALFLGVLVEFREYYLPNLVHSGIQPVDLYGDTVIDLVMDLYGGLFGAFGRLFLFDPRKEN